MRTFNRNNTENVKKARKESKQLRKLRSQGRWSNDNEVEQNTKKDNQYDTHDGDNYEYIY